MKKPKTDTCYKCGAPATSREHVPPQCIFPEQKDVHKDYRQNLITVPSCDEHNQKKTNEDEFFMMSITPGIENNSIGLRQTRTKIKRAYKTKSPKFRERILSDFKLIPAKEEHDEKYLWFGRMDIGRMDKCVQLIASGLYYHEYKEPFKGDFNIIYAFTIDQDHIIKDFKFFFSEKMKIEFEKQEIKGTNPEIFTYQIVPKDSFGVILLKMTFFEGSTIIVLLVSEDADLNGVEEMKKSIEWEAVNNLAQIMETSDNSNRLKKLNEHLTKFPPSTYYYALKGSTHRNLKQFEEAKINYLNSLSLDTNNIEALNGLGLLYDYQFDDKDQARNYYEKALTIEPNQTIVRLNLGVLLDKKFKDKEAAKNQYEIILSYDSNEYKAHNNLANYYRSFSDDINRGKAVFHFERAIEITPTFIDAYLNYGSFLQTINQKEKSRMILQKVKKLLKGEEPILIVVNRLIDQTYN